MRIAVMGSGGVGGYFGGRLAAGGSDVTFIARGRHLEALRASGLTIRSQRGDLRLTDVQATSDPGSLRGVDLVLVSVKLWDTEAAAAAVRPLSEAGAAVVSFQNGVQKDALLCDALGARSVFGGVSYIAATIAEPGVISHAGLMQRLVFGEFDGQLSDRTDAFLEACRAGGIDAELSRDIRLATWEKFVFLAGFSGATTTMRMPIGPIRENARSRAFLLDLMREAVAVGRAHGIGLPQDFAENRLAFCDTLPAAMTSSMHNDLERGNRLEVPWLSGGVVALGQAVGCETPLNRAVSDILELHAAGRPRE